MADQDEPAGFNTPTWVEGIGSKRNTPFNIQEFRELSAGLQTHDVEEGMTNVKMSEGDSEESYAAMRSVVTVSTAAAQEARENPRVDELRERVVKE